MTHGLKYWLCLFTASMVLSAVAASGERTSAAEFLQRARNPKSASTYGRFRGTLQHRRRGQDPREMAIYFGIVIKPRETIGRILVDSRESYLIRQAREAGRDGTSVVRDPQNAEILDWVGMRVSDLTMSFLYYKLVKELDETTLSTVVSCRVLLLESPDDTPGGKEYVKVYLEKEHAFPLKAEFFRSPEDKKPFRLVETNGFTQKNDLYYARTILVEGPGWRTKVEFNPDLVELGMFDNTTPQQPILFPGIGR